MKPMSHRKIVVERSAVDHDAFADFYCFGACPGRATPLVVYFGGAISTDVYDARRETEPESLVELFEDALSTREIESVDLLVVPCPLIGRTYPDFRSRISRFILDELLPRTQNPEPEALVFFGNCGGRTHRGDTRFRARAGSGGCDHGRCGPCGSGRRERAAALRRQAIQVVRKRGRPVPGSHDPLLGGDDPARHPGRRH